MCSYQSHEEMIKRLERLQTQYPNLVRVESLGKSVRGKDLVYAKLSENVARRSRGEPMFKFVANMHGDETLGRQMLLYLAEYLALHYENDEVRHERSEKSLLCNFLALFAMPDNSAACQVSSQRHRDISDADAQSRRLRAIYFRVHHQRNPEFHRGPWIKAGLTVQEFSSYVLLRFYVTSSSRRRSNSNLVDLNRNFPSWTDIKKSLKGNFDLKKNREKETM